MSSRSSGLTATPVGSGHEIGQWAGSNRMMLIPPAASVTAECSVPAGTQSPWPGGTSQSRELVRMMIVPVEAHKSMGSPCA